MAKHEPGTGTTPQKGGETKQLAGGDTNLGGNETYPTGDESKSMTGGVSKFPTVE